MLGDAVDLKHLNPIIAQVIKQKQFEKIYANTSDKNKGSGTGRVPLTKTRKYQR